MSTQTPERDALDAFLSDCIAKGMSIDVMHNAMRDVLGFQSTTIPLAERTKWPFPVRTTDDAAAASSDKRGDDLPF